LAILNQLTKKIQNIDVDVGKELFIIPERELAIKFATQIAKK
jgi:hypothetical protein